MPSDDNRLDAVITAIDAANTADPTHEDGRPASLLYGERMSEELDRLFPDACDALKIAARGQHVERWLLPRSDYPEGREGYYAWRREQGKRHAARVAAIMADAGYGADDIAHAERMLRKEDLKRNPDVQRLEDVICFVFLRWYFTPFAKGKDPDALLRIVTRTARKMSAEGRIRALAEFGLPEPFAAAFRD
ncbi:DUF4202 domain-containing protein [uncultured Roseibium sp.]|uniref:DUF4202 domain-containing protein n=1 Tax=uncultured Roseibium sp. TaxID=1936171 RepID=UPI003216CE5E